MKKISMFFACLLLTIPSFSQSSRVALVIGNSNYKAGAPLANPVNDATDITEVLKSAGFDVKSYVDLDQVTMKKVIDEFGQSLEKAETALFFYAGHGIQSRGRNYLIPVDAILKTENDVEYNCVDAGRILAQMEDGGTETNIVILDACRNNPFERSWSRKSTGAGLAFMDAPNGSIIAYSTAPGKTADDGYYDNSPYTSALIQYLEVPNLKIEDFFKLVRLKVSESTQGQQTPWESTSLVGDFYFQLDPSYVSPDASIESIEPGLVNMLKDLNNSDPLQRMNNFEESRKELASGIRSIAILPFANYTGDESKAYLAMGMQDALISELGQLGTVKVTSQTSTLSYANYTKTIEEIASELNVDGIIETAIIGLGEKIRIQLKMYSASPDEEMVWNQVFDSDMSDILNLYNRVIKNIADEIHLSLSPEKEQALGKTRLVDAEAYDAYLKGRYYWADLTRESLNKAHEYLIDGIEKDPNWAPLYAGLAQVWVGLAQMGYESPEIAGPNIIKNITKALELDSDFPDLNFTLGIISVWTEWNWDVGEKTFLKALAINPNDAMSRMYYAHLLAILQRTDEALVQAQLAMELDPNNPLILALHSAVFICARKYDLALKQINLALSFSPEDEFIHGLRELAAFHSKEYDIAFESFRFFLSEIGFSDKKLKDVEIDIQNRGYNSAYEGILLQLDKMNQESNVMSGCDLASRFTLVNNSEKALEWYEKAFKMHDPNLPYLLTGVGKIEPLLGIPRFIDIVQKMNLPLPEK